MVKLDTKTSFKKFTHRDMPLIETDGYLLETDEFDDIELVVSKVKGGWGVFEKSTGVSLGLKTLKTREAAADLGITAVMNNGVDKTKAYIKAWLTDLTYFKMKTD